MHDDIGKGTAGGTLGTGEGDGLGDGDSVGRDGDGGRQGVVAGDGEGEGDVIGCMEEQGSVGFQCVEGNGEVGQTFGNRDRERDGSCHGVEAFGTVPPEVFESLSTAAAGEDGGG